MKLLNRVVMLSLFTGLSGGVLAQLPNISYSPSSVVYVLNTGITTTVPVNAGGGTVANGQTINYSGTGSATSTGTTLSTATFNQPLGATVDKSGNLYIAEAGGGSHLIRKITPDGQVSVFAGSYTNAYGDGQGTLASFWHPVGLASDAAGNIYVADEDNNCIRKITPAGLVSTVAGIYNMQGTTDGATTVAKFKYPCGVAVAASGNIYVADTYNNLIRKITPGNIVSTLAGNGTAVSADGTGISASFNQPFSIVVDASENLYVTDRQGHKIRKVTSGGMVSTLAGSGSAGWSEGTGAAASFNAPTGLAIDNSAGYLYVTDQNGNRVRRVQIATGAVTTVAGTGSAGSANAIGTATTYSAPFGLALNPATGFLNVGDLNNSLIRNTAYGDYTISPALPAGLSFNTKTGEIIGAPTVLSPATDYMVNAYNYTNPGVSGTTVNITINSSSITPPSSPLNDYDRNWIQAQNYDENGNEISASKAFFDNNGKPTQTQVKNESTGQILASQTLYDLQGRAAANTLIAPTNNASFAYSSNFVSDNSGKPYDCTNFDWNVLFNSQNPYLKTNNPDPVANTQQGTLGWYYSNNNTLEPMVATTGFPYSRTDFYRDGTGAAKRAASIGETLKMGAGHEASSSSFPVQHELDNYLGIRNKFFPTAVVGSSPTTLAGQALQSVSTDQNGTSVLSVTDLSGKMDLMEGRADVNGWLTVQNSAALSNIQGQYSFTITVDGAASIDGDPRDPVINAMLHALVLRFSVSSSNPVTVTNNGGSVATWTGAGNDYISPSAPMTGSYSFTITSFFPFSITTSNSYGTVGDHMTAQYAEPIGSSIQYFQLATPSAVNITGNYTLYNMKTDADLTSGFNSGSILPVGYYKVTATAPTDNSINNVTITYTNKYADITYNYYNQLGQLIASIAPNGVQKLMQTGYSSYTSASQLPFVTLYQYDLQGRMIAVTTPDGGMAQYIYRQDGKIRFSQNSYQKVAANAGSGKFERFSYTNYDTFGRPAESGEYAVASSTFAGLATNTTLIEATGAAANIAAATKLFNINTYYDSPATNLGLTGYVQDAGFLKGAVSYTTNANSTTWYNYDDHERVNWMVKQIPGLAGYKTLNYTYNDQGNVSVVEYQRGTAAERFFHYYTYDADGRLINVQTSTDGVAMVQQAHYYYYLHGPLKRTELGDKLQGIDYTYTSQGWLKAINTATGDSNKDPSLDGVSNSFAKDAFGMQLEYFNGDYSRSGSNVTGIPTGTIPYYNGNVTGMSWQSNKPATVVSTDPGGTIQNPTMYSYTYDPKYQYTQSVWGAPNYSNGTFAPATKFGESGINYDANGNIQALQRTDGNGTVSDNFSKYTYTANTNKLTGVGTSAAPTAFASYAYDELGRLKSESQTGTTAPKFYLQYDVTGKVTAIYSDVAMTTPVTTYSYDETGNRIKTVNATGTTYYVYDPSGNVLAIYTATAALPTPALAEQPVYGSDRLGTFFKTGAIYVYEMRDNVGSVRVAMNRNKVSGQADIIQYNDYYPYGLVARKGGIGYRYEYQGAYAEKDPATGFNNFDLRMYDSRIGRWLTIDPVGQYSSPYESMGNSPNVMTDPTGAYSSKFWATFHRDLSFDFSSEIYSIEGSNDWGYNSTTKDANGNYGIAFNDGGREPNFASTITTLAYRTANRIDNEYYESKTDHFHGKVNGEEGKRGTLNVSHSNRGYEGSDVSLGNVGFGVDGVLEGGVLYFTIGHVTAYAGLGTEGFKYGRYVKNNGNVSGEDNYFKPKIGNTLKMASHYIYTKEGELGGYLHRAFPPIGSGTSGAPGAGIWSEFSF